MLLRRSRWLGDEVVGANEVAVGLGVDTVVEIVDEILLSVVSMRGPFWCTYCSAIVLATPHSFDVSIQSLVLKSRSCA